MKLTGFLGALLLAFVAVMFGASTAQAADYTPGGSVTVSPPTNQGHGCSTRTITVSVPAGTTSVTLTVRRDSTGQVVYHQTKPTNGASSVSFEVRVCGGGNFTATATDQNGQVIGSTTFHNNGAGGGGGQGGGTSGSTSSPSSSTGSSSTGGLANTGASTAMTVGGIAAMLLVVGGAALLMASRRRA